ncbi:MAG: septum formation protein Maf [Planctomycetes bacterium]|nr:septum formation protein Maf [Planctomycetota bacterium]
MEEGEVSPAPLVLASSSRYRIALLERLGIPFQAVGHRCEERSAAPAAVSPEEVVRALARAKAESLRAEFPSALILGSDQVVELDGELLGKPGTQEAAVKQLLRLQGREHRLVTAVALSRPGGPTEVEIDVHQLRMRSLSDAEIRHYVERDRPLDCAGSYRFESLGIALFEGILGEDATAIVGLPLIRTISMLARAGISPLA